MESNVINHPESVQKGAEGERTEAEEPEPMASSIPLLPVMFGFRGFFRAVSARREPCHSPHRYVGDNIIPICAFSLSSPYLSLGTTKLLRWTSVCGFSATYSIGVKRKKKKKNRQLNNGG